MSSQDKRLSLLDAFRVEAPVWSAQELAARSELAPSTCYRYLKSLHQAGLLARRSGHDEPALDPKRRTRPTLA